MSYTYPLPGVRKYASMMRLLGKHRCTDIVSWLTDKWYQNVLWNLSEKASYFHKGTLRQLSWNPVLNDVHYSMKQLLVAVELQKNKITFIYVSWWSEACNDKGSTNHIMNMTVLIILLPDCFVTKLSVAFYQRRERIVEDEGFIYYFVFNTVSLKREKGCYKMERNQLCATINNVYY